MEELNNSKMLAEDKENLKNYLGFGAPVPELNNGKFNNINCVIGKIEFYKKNKIDIKFRLMNKQNYEFSGKIISLKKVLNDGYFVIETKDTIKMIFSISEIDHESIMPDKIYPIISFLRPFIPESIRLNIFSRDNHVCQYKFDGCLINKELEIDHIIPISLGGSSEVSNLITSCSNCNKKKGNRWIF